MKYKVGDWVVFKEPLMGMESNDGFILKEVFGKDIVRRIIDIDEKFYVVGNYGGHAVRVKHKDLEGVTNIFNKAPSIVKRINDKHHILNGLLNSDGSVDGEKLMEKLSKKSNVKHPSHYNNGIECIDYINSHNLNFNAGNIVKYATRYLRKGKPIEDLEKIIEYAQFEIKRLQEERPVQ